jgi:hypothetical protein
VGLRRVANFFPKQNPLSDRDPRKRFGTFTRLPFPSSYGIYIWKTRLLPSLLYLLQVIFIFSSYFKILSIFGRTRDSLRFKLLISLFRCLLCTIECPPGLCCFQHKSRNFRRFVPSLLFLPPLPLPPLPPLSPLLSFPPLPPNLR